MKALFVCLLLISPAQATELEILTLDGTIHRLSVEGATVKRHRRIASNVDGPKSIAGGLLLHGDKLGRVGIRKKIEDLPGTFALDFLANAGKRIFGGTRTGELYEIDVEHPQLVPLGEWRSLTAIAATDNAVVVAHEAIVGVRPMGGDAETIRVEVQGDAIALAATADKKIFAATRAGNLYEIDRHAGPVRELGLGDWRGTVAMVATDDSLYLATLNGTLWHIDRRSRRKTAIERHGWEGTLSMSLASSP